MGTSKFFHCLRQLDLASKLMNYPNQRPRVTEACLISANETSSYFSSTESENHMLLKHNLSDTSLKSKSTNGKKYRLNLGLQKHLKVNTVGKLVYTLAERQWLGIKYLEFKWPSETTLFDYLAIIDPAFSVQRIWANYVCKRFIFSSQLLFSYWYHKLCVPKTLKYEFISYQQLVKGWRTGIYSKKYNVINSVIYASV